jgi:hypothetical protein
VHLHSILGHHLVFSMRRPRGGPGKFLDREQEQEQEQEEEKD